MKKRYIASFAFAALLALLAFYSFRENKTPNGELAADPSAAAESSSSQPESGMEPRDSLPNELSVSAQAASALEPTDTVMQTRSMVAAHASLRAPEVADPDSETNRRIMQQMVLQAFENAKSDPRQ